MNSSQFFVLDQSEEFLFVFDTSPLKDITADAVTVTYVSDVDFNGGVDRFRFVASDGLADSEAGLATVTVNRAFRPPVALPPGPIALDEDAADVPVLLGGDDPDGILGVDFNGLDTLEYVILDPPAQGTLGGSGSTRSYTPDPDYYGPDAFTYRVSDGVFESAPATVTLEVRPVVDAPRLNYEPIAPLSRGFPGLITVPYSDADRDPEESYAVAVSWGDGTTAEQGIVDPATGMPTGPLIVPFNPGSGMISAPHSYADAGTYTFNAVIVDTQGGGVGGVFDSTTITVIEAAELGLRLYEGAAPPVGYQAPTIEIPPGASKTLHLEVENKRPASYPGIDANDVEVTVRGSLGLAFTPPSGCSPGADAATLVCALGSLAPGSPLVLDLEVLAIDTGFPAVFASLEAIVRYRDVNGARERETAASVVVTWTDTDGDTMPDAYERGIGSDPNVADGDGDANGNGIDDLEDYLSYLDGGAAPGTLPARIVPTLPAWTYGLFALLLSIAGLGRLRSGSGFALRRR